VRRYFPEDADLGNYLNTVLKFNQNRSSRFQENRHFVFEAHLKCPYFWSKNVHTHRAPIYAG
jgi:hypothetical protein